MYINIADYIHYVCEYDDSLKIFNWFNLDDYKIYSINELEKILDTHSFEEIEMYKRGYIAFPSFQNDDMQREFIKSINDRRLSNRLFLLSDEKFSVEFWKHTDDGGYMLGRWYDFLDSKKENILIEWCHLNNIKYRHNKK